VFKIAKMYGERGVPNFVRVPNKNRCSTFCSVLVVLLWRMMRLPGVHSRGGEGGIG
jgi:hypothetical protein